MAESFASGLSIYCTGVLLAVLSMSMSTSVVVREGQSVQMNCSHGLQGKGFNAIVWLKQTNHSAPVCVLSILFNQENPRNNNVNFCTGFDRSRMDCSVDSWTSSVEIRRASVSDSGLYYCGRMGSVFKDYILFNNATYLTVTDPVSESEPPEDGQFCKGGTVVLFLSAILLLSVVLNLLLCILIQTRRRGGLTQNTGPNNTDPGEQTPSPPAQDLDSLNYAALNFSAKKKRRSNFNLQTDNPHVIYAATR
ncbi:uncharacterized protein LOC143127907 [Alosa pseudoharengus]|uniref:uncharacterized protein LOC143127907 n=1 Tax=Alosa pseudoharengus TaxID=34774 RepID=UPI003F8C98EB